MTTTTKKELTPKIKQKIKGDQKIPKFKNFGWSFSVTNNLGQNGHFDDNSQKRSSRP